MTTKLIKTEFKIKDIILATKHMQIFNLKYCFILILKHKYLVLSIYITKFVPQSIGSNSDFSNPVYAMNALSTGTDDIISESGVIIGNIRSIVIDAGIYTNLSNTYSYL